MGASAITQLDECVDIERPKCITAILPMQARPASRQIREKTPTNKSHIPDRIDELTNW